MEEKKYQQCAGPGCTNLIEQVSTGRGHRAKLYCHKNCCMAAIRERERLAKAEAERQRQAELVRIEKETLRKRFAGISEESIDLLYQLRYDVNRDKVGKALAAERLAPGPAVEKSLGEYAGEIADLRRELALRTRERDDVRKLAGDATGHTVRWQEKAGEYKHLLKEAEERARNLADQVDDLTNQLAEASQGEAQAARIAVLEHDLTQARKQASPALLANISELEQKIASLQPKKLRAKIDELTAKAKDLEAERDQAIHAAEKALAELKAADSALAESEAKLRWQEEANHALATSRNDWMQKASQSTSKNLEHIQQKNELLRRAEQAEQALASAQAQLDKSASETPEEVSRLRARLTELWRENQEYEAKLAQIAAEQNTAPRIA
jgi:polyhydroxyalkanoate synthesis regulator phasin